MFTASISPLPPPSTFSLCLSIYNVPPWTAQRWGFTFYLLWQQWSMIAVFDPFTFNVMTDAFGVLWPSCYLSFMFSMALYFQFCFGLVKYFLAFHSISSIDLSSPPLKCLYWRLQYSSLSYDGLSWIKSIKEDPIYHVSLLSSCFYRFSCVYGLNIKMVYYVCFKCSFLQRICEKKKSLSYSSLNVDITLCFSFLSDTEYVQLLLAFGHTL